MSKDSQRNPFLDFQKAILIFCVVWTHCTTSLEAGVIQWKDNYLNVTVTTFQMPLFILISGYLLFFSFQRNTPVVIIFKKILEVAVPAAIWNLGAFGVSLVTAGEPIIFDLALIKSAIFAIIGGLWYLWVYFFCTIVVCIVNLVTKKEWIRIGLFFLVEIVSHFVNMNTWYFGFMFPFFLLGYYCNYFIQKSPNIQKWKMRYAMYILICLYPFFWLWYRPEYSMYITGVLFDTQNIAYTLHAYFIRFATGISGCATVYLGSKAIYNFLRSKNVNLDWICNIGKHSMAIYILHMYMIDFIYAISEYYNIGMFMSSNMFLLNFVISPILACILIALCTMIRFVLSHIPIIKDCIFGISINTLKNLMK